MEGQYYENYRLNDDVFSWDLDDREKSFLNAAIWLVDNRLSIRASARNYSLPYTSFWEFLHWKLPYISTELYDVVKNRVFK